MSFNMPRLSTEQKKTFIEQGFLKVEQVVPQVFINRALRAINHSLGQGRDTSDIAKLNSQSWCPELGQTEIIHDMFNRSPALSLAEDLLGPDNVLPCYHGQVPPRFPQDIEKDRSNVKINRGHIDGIGSGINGIPLGEYHRGFTCLCVVLLSNLPEDFMGNFAVWPKSHHVVSEHLIKHGHEILAQGMPELEDPEPMHMCKGQAGDIIFAHQLLKHAASPNLSPFIRYAAIFRVCHKNIKGHENDLYEDMWCEFEGIQDLVQEQQHMQ